MLDMAQSARENVTPQSGVTREMPGLPLFFCLLTFCPLASDFWLSSADNRKNGNLITRQRDMIQVTVARVDHGYADLVRINILGQYNIPHRGSRRKGKLSDLETVFPEKGKELDRYHCFLSFTHRRISAIVSTPNNPGQHGYQ